MSARPHSTMQSLVVSCGEDEHVRLWDLRENRGVMSEPIVQDGPGMLWCLAWSQNGNDIAVGTDEGTIRILDMRQGIRQRQCLSSHTSAVRSVDYSDCEGRETLASGADDSTAKLWSVGSSGSDLVCIKTLKGHRSWVNRVRWARGGHYLLTSSQDATVRLWKPLQSTSVILEQGHRQAVFDASMSSDGAFVVTGSADRTVLLWDSSMGAVALDARAARRAAATKHSSTAEAVVENGPGRQRRNSINQAIDSDIEGETFDLDRQKLPAASPPSPPSSPSLSNQTSRDCKSFLPKSLTASSSNFVSLPTAAQSSVAADLHSRITAHLKRTGHGDWTKHFSGGLRAIILTAGLVVPYQQVRATIGLSFPALAPFVTVAKAIRANYMLEVMNSFRASVFAHPDVLHVTIHDDAHWTDYPSEKASKKPGGGSIVGAGVHEASAAAAEQTFQDMLASMSHPAEALRVTAIESKNLVSIAVTSQPFALLTANSRIERDKVVSWQDHCGPSKLQPPPQPQQEPPLVYLHPQSLCSGPGAATVDTAFENYVREMAKNVHLLPTEVSEESEPPRLSSSRVKELRLQALIEDYSAAFFKLSDGCRRAMSKAEEDLLLATQYNLPFRPATLPCPWTLASVKGLIADASAGPMMLVIRVSGIAHGSTLQRALRRARKEAGMDGLFEVVLDSDLARGGLPSAIEDRGIIEQLRSSNKQRASTATSALSSSPSLTSLMSSQASPISATFTDLAALRCILILCERGRTGDVFPPSFAAYDLRLRHTNPMPMALIASSLLNDLGRVGRYCAQDSPPPRVVLSKPAHSILHLDLPEDIEKLRACRPDAHVLVPDLAALKLAFRYSDARPISQGIRPELQGADQAVLRSCTTAGPMNPDFNNHSTHPANFLLHGPPQCGKTGAYLAVLALLQADLKKSTSAARTTSSSNLVPDPAAGSSRIEVQVLPDDLQVGVAAPSVVDPEDARAMWGRWPDPSVLRKICWSGVVLANTEPSFLESLQDRLQLASQRSSAEPKVDLPVSKPSSIKPTLSHGKNTEGAAQASAPKKRATFAVAWAGDESDHDSHTDKEEDLTEVDPPENDVDVTTSSTDSNSSFPTKQDAGSSRSADASESTETSASVSAVGAPFNLSLRPTLIKRLHQRTMSFKESEAAAVLKASAIKTAVVASSSNSASAFSLASSSPREPEPLDPTPQAPETPPALSAALDSEAFHGLLTLVDAPGKVTERPTKVGVFAVPLVSAKLERALGSRPFAVLLVPNTVPPVFHLTRKSEGDTIGIHKALGRVTTLLHNVSAGAKDAMELVLFPDGIVSLSTSSLPESCALDPIFIPSSGRSRTALIKLESAMGDVSYVEILVVSESEIGDYYPQHPGHTILVLPNLGSNMIGCSIGYYRHCITAVSQYWGLEGCWMMDDNILGAQELLLKDDPYLDERSAPTNTPSKLGEVVPLSTVMAELASWPTKDEVAIAGFVRYSTAVAIDQFKVKWAFSPRCPRSLVHLNIALLTKHNLNFDVDLADGEVDALAHAAAIKGLIVLRSNRYVIHKAARLSGGKQQQRWQPKP